MNDLRWVRTESPEEGIRVLTLDRPPVNALGRDLVADLAEAARRLRSDSGARVAVLRGAGRHFCAGADLKERREMTEDEVRRFVPELSATFTAIARLPIPTVAAVRGAAIGGGCELALACDLRILSDDARIGLRETALAILPGAGGTQRLPRLIGPARAKRWIFTAAVHDADEALRDGVADRVVPADGLDRAAVALARAIAANGPVAVRLAKRAIDDGVEAPIDDGLRFEWQAYRETIATEDRVEALRAFAEKREPRFRGR